MTVYKNGKLWWYDFYFKKTRYKGPGGLTKTEAKRVEAKVRSEVLAGTYNIDISRAIPPKLKDFIPIFIKRHQIKSIKRIEISLNNILKFKPIREKRLHEIRSQDLHNYISYRQASEISNSTINRELSALSKLYNLAIKWSDSGYNLQKNPVKDIDSLPETQFQDETYTVEEYEKLLKYAPIYLERILIMAANTGMRLKEILNVRWEHIHYIENYADVELFNTKGGEQTRIPLNPSTTKMIKRIPETSEYVFTGLRGQRLYSVRKPLIQTFKESGVKPRRNPIHALRHFWTTEAFKSSGGDVAAVQEIGRWKDLKTMLRYCHTDRNRKQQVVNNLEVHLSNSPIYPLKSENE